MYDHKNEPLVRFWKAGNGGSFTSLIPQPKCLRDDLSQEINIEWVIELLELVFVSMPDFWHDT